jgi:hypothetical protein
VQFETGGIPHPNLSDKVNRDIVRSEIEGGVYLNHVASNTRLEVETQNRRYTLWVRENGEVLIWGHPVYCPAPTAVRISGSNWGGSMLKAGFIGRGMHMEFRHPEHKTVVTSRVREVREIAVASHQSSVASLQNQ